MNDFNNDPTLRRVRGLLKKAESLYSIGDENSVREAEAANALAAKLISKHGIDQALLADKGEIKDVIVNKLIPLSAVYQNDKRVLFNSIVHALGAQVIFIRSRRPGTAQSYTLSAHVFAYESDMARIELLFEMLQPQMLLGAAAAHVPYWENARSFRKSWMSGFISAIHGRLKATKKEATKEAGTGTDLVLFNREKAVEVAYKATFDPKHTINSAPRRLAGSGREQGYAAGQKASFGGNNIGGSRRALAG